ncbi:hypothetical protein pb186bvf_009380 [Paramecium bursaria]
MIYTFPKHFLQTIVNPHSQNYQCHQHLDLNKFGLDICSCPYLKNFRVQTKYLSYIIQLKYFAEIL